MSNPRVKSQLEKISIELAKVNKHVRDYHGVSADEARLIDSLATEIATQGAAIAGMAREAQGDTSAKGLTKKVRKALGFTYP
jgi:hypothetical protein